MFMSMMTDASLCRGKMVIYILKNLDEKNSSQGSSQMKMKLASMKMKTATSYMFHTNRAMIRI